MSTHTLVDESTLSVARINNGSTLSIASTTNQEHFDEAPQVEDSKEKQEQTEKFQGPYVTDLERIPEQLRPDISDETKNREYPTGLKLALILFATFISIFLVALDRLIIATAIPRITDQFHALDDVGWYAGAYLITTCATQLFWGRLYTFYSTKWTLLTSIAIFEIGSLICAVSPNSIAFIIGRAIAGLGNSGIFAGATVLVTEVVPLHKRPVYMGAIGSIFGIASIIGPLLGGVFTNNVSWRWCFYINLPLGGITIVILVFLLRLAPKENSASLRQQIIRLDPLGTLVFLSSTICLLLALQFGGATYPWDNARVIALFVLAGVLAIAFTGLQMWQQENSTLPPRIIRNRSISLGATYSLCVGGAMISLLYCIPIWFQAVKGVSAVRSGIDTLPMVLALVVSAIISGSIITRTGWYNPWMFFSATLMSIGAGLITTWRVDTGHAKWIGYQVIFGLGLGTGMQQSSLAAQAILSQIDVPTGVSIMFLAQNLGGAIFISVGQSVFTNHLVSGLSAIAGIDASQILASGATGVRSAVSSSQLTTVLMTYNDALVKAFIVALAVSCFSLVPALGMEWKNVKKENLHGNAEQVAVA